MGRKKTTNMPNPPEEDEDSKGCKSCPKLVAKEDYGIQCDACLSWSHLECCDVSLSVYKLYQSSNMDNVGFKWFCTDCRNKYDDNSEVRKELKKVENFMDDTGKALNVLQKEMSNLKEMMQENGKSLNKEIDNKLNDKVVNMVQSYSKIVSKDIKKTIENNQVITAINNNLKCVKTNIDKTKEIEDENKARKDKEFNVCVFNIPEGTGEDKETDYKSDIKKLKQVFEGKIEIKPDDIKTVYRIGVKKTDSNKPRPFIMKFNCLSKRKEVLSLRNLFYKKKVEDDIERDLTDGVEGIEKQEKKNGNRVFVHPDRTKKEVEEHRKLVDQLKKRQNEGEENIGIRNGQIIKFGNPFRDRPQFSWGEC